jgi:hypothetical protein
MEQTTGKDGGVKQSRRMRSLSKRWRDISIAEIAYDIRTLRDWGSTEDSRQGFMWEGVSEILEQPLTKIRGWYTFSVSLR